MALTPVFYGSSEELAELLRLKNLAGGSSSQRIFEAAIRKTRATLYLELGQTLLDNLAAESTSDAPTTDAGYKRLIAETVEVDLCRYHLMDSLRAGWVENASEFLALFQQVPTARLASIFDAQEVKDNLWNDPRSGIGMRLDVLRGELVAGAIDDSAFVVGAEEAGHDYLKLRYGALISGSAWDGVVDYLVGAK